MKTKTLIKLFTLFIFSLFVSCDENDDVTEITCELNYETTFAEIEDNVQAINFDATASVSESDATFFWSVDGEQQNENTTSFEYVFTENGTYEVCIFTETPECPQGVEFCEDVIVDNIVEADPINEEEEDEEEETEVSCELSYEFELQSSEDGKTIEAIFEAVADVSEEEASLFWAINGDLLDFMGDKLEYTFTENGTYVICVLTETPECPSGYEFNGRTWGAGYCQEIIIDNIVACPEFEVYAEPLGDENYLFGLYDYSDIGNIDTIHWLLMDAQTQEVTNLGNGMLEINYQFTSSGTYMVCALDTNCNTQKCQEVEVVIEEENDELTVTVGASTQTQNNPDDVCPNLTYTFEAVQSLVYEFEAKVNNEINEDYVYFWSVNDEHAYSGSYNQDSGKSFEYAFDEAGTYSICVGIETPECASAIFYCTDFIVE